MRDIRGLIIGMCFVLFSCMVHAANLGVPLQEVKGAFAKIGYRFDVEGWKDGDLFSLAKADRDCGTVTLISDGTTLKGLLIKFKQVGACVEGDNATIMLGTIMVGLKAAFKENGNEAYSLFMKDIEEGIGNQQTEYAREHSLGGKSFRMVSKKGGELRVIVAPTPK